MTAYDRKRLRAVATRRQLEAERDAALQLDQLVAHAASPALLGEITVPRSPLFAVALRAFPATRAITYIHRLLGQRPLNTTRFRALAAIAHACRPSLPA